MERSQRIAGGPPGVPVQPGVLFKVRHDLARGIVRVAPGADKVQGVEGGFVRVDLVPQKDEGVRQLLRRFFLEPHRRRVQGVHAEAPGVVGEVQGVGRLVGRGDAAGAEDELYGLPFPQGANAAQGERRAGLRPPLLAVEFHLVLVALPRLQACHVDQGVVVVSDTERGGGATEDLDLAGRVRLDPYGYLGRSGVTQQGSEDEIRHPRRRSQRLFRLP